MQGRPLTDEERREFKRTRPKGGYNWTAIEHSRGVQSQNFQRFIVTRKLTDRTIRKYEKIGRYSEAYKQARREAMAKKGQRIERNGPFIKVGEDWVYSPV